jgi:osmotically-inducible protein OsmY
MRDRRLTDAAAVPAAVRRELEGVPGLAPHRHSLHIAFDGDALTLEGEVADISVKKLVLERAAAVPGVRGIVDRLRVAPALRMGDGEIRDHVRDALLGEPALAECALYVLDGERREVARAPAEARGRIDVRVEDGVVTLDGEAPSLSHKRLAGVLAWWVPGSRDVVNGLGVEPPEEDNDDEITDALRIVLEKDPGVDASRITIRTRNAVVTLEGVVPTTGEREMAERDAWYVFAVDGVVNRLEVR